MQTVQHITIFGTGLLGTSIALGLRKAGFARTIVGVGRRDVTLDAARRLGCFTELTLQDDAWARLDDCHLVVLATPLRWFEPLLQKLASKQHEAMVITDVGSTKRKVCDDAQRLLRRPGQFVGSHPMAGGEQHGPANASADLFRHAPCIITRTDASDAIAVTLVESLWTTLGMRITHMSPAEHDQRVATISHLPHAVAALLVDLAVREQSLSVASTGFRDTTRIASGDVQVWTDIFMTNREACMEAADALIAELRQFRDKLERGDEQAIHDLLHRAKAARDHWTHGA